MASKPKRERVRRQGLSRLPKIAPTRYRVGFPWHGLDLRSEDGRFLGHFIGDVVQDLGGVDQLTRAQITLIERASYHALKCCQFESADLTPGSPGPNWTAADYSSHVTVLRRILLDLGLTRVAKSAMTLAEYFEQRATQDAQQHAQDARSPETDADAAAQPSNAQEGAGAA